jgi:hypothetical protein
MIEQLIPVLIVAAVGLCVLGGLVFLSGQSGLDHIKSRTVGDGQHGTARSPPTGGTGASKTISFVLPKETVFGFQRKGTGVVTPANLFY